MQFRPTRFSGAARSRVTASSTPVRPVVGSPIRGIAYMVAALFLLTVGDALTKWVGSSLPVGQVIFFRALFIFIPTMAIVFTSGGLATLKVTDRRGVGTRAVLYCCTTALITTSMILLPLADASALLFAGPLFVTALATPMLGEYVGWRRWTAVLVGFVGVIIMLRPTPDAIQVLAVVPIVAALFSAFRDITTRRISATESSNAIMFWSNVVLLAAAALTAPFGWEPMRFADLAQLALLGIIVGVAHWVMIEAYRFGEAAVVSPFKYTAIVWATLLGYFVWGTVPDAFIISGGALVIASGLYILHRETRRKAG
ncbi:MAG: EamA family transporter [Alphaproteobacteria bacterium]|nr:EamA family transporter [Alphaproteobacteria bacterium]